jgi:hypothetical protein
VTIVSRIGLRISLASSSLPEVVGCGGMRSAEGIAAVGLGIVCVIILAYPKHILADLFMGPIPFNRVLSWFGGKDAGSRQDQERDQPQPATCAQFSVLVNCAAACS